MSTYETLYLMTFKLNGQTLPEPSYPITAPSTTDDIDPVEYVEVGDDEDVKGEQTEARQKRLDY